jgi:hypothetical protein
MRLFTLSWLRALFAYVVLVTVFLFYGQTSFYHDPGSVFFDETRAFERLYSTHREHEVRQFIDEVRSDLSDPILHAKSGPRICASFLSVKREGDQYLPVFCPSTEIVPVLTQIADGCEQSTRTLRMRKRRFISRYSPCSYQHQRASFVAIIMAIWNCRQHARLRCHA